MLRRLFGPRTGEVKGEWRRLLNEELMVFTTQHILFGLSSQEEFYRQVV
jgi:hypothetical protein